MREVRAKGKDTYEELKNKVIKVIQNVALWEDSSSWCGIDQPTAEKLADALIAAGIGDVSSEKAMRELAEAFHREKCAEYDLINYKLQKAEHRAEVAEKELLVYKEVASAMLSEIDCFNEGYCPEFYKDPECENCIKKKIYGNSAATFPCLLDKYIRQAEKELAEEGKDE